MTPKDIPDSNAGPRPTPPACEEAPDRRGAPRHRTVYRTAKIEKNGDEGLCRVRNVSDDGVQLKLSMPVMLGDRLLISLADPCTLEGRVVWTDGEYCGVAFDRPIDSLKTLQYVSDVGRNHSSRPHRVKFDDDAMVSGAGAPFLVRVQDISERGMKITDPCGFTPGMQVTVRTQSGLERGAVVRWAHDGIAGLMLLEPLDVEQLGSIRALNRQSKASRSGIH